MEIMPPKRNSRLVGNYQLVLKVFKNNVIIDQLILPRLSAMLSSIGPHHCDLCGMKEFFWFLQHVKQSMLSE